MALQMTLFPMDSHYLDSINTLTWLSLLELQTIEKITPQQYLGEGPGVSRLVKVTSQPLLNWSKIFYCLSRGAKNAHCSICEIFWSKDQHSRFGKWVFSSFQDNFIHIFEYLNDNLNKTFWPESKIKCISLLWSDKSFLLTMKYLKLCNIKTYFWYLNLNPTCKWGLRIIRPNNSSRAKQALRKRF